MKHEWAHVNQRVKAIHNHGKRVCIHCLATQTKESQQQWMRVTGYQWMPLVGRCKKMTLTEKIIKYLRGIRSASDWQIANAIYNDCMQSPNKANGARIANIRVACFKSPKIGSVPGGDYFYKLKPTKLNTSILL